MVDSPAALVCFEASRVNSGNSCWLRRSAAVRPRAVGICLLFAATLFPPLAIVCVGGGGSECDDDVVVVAVERSAAAVVGARRISYLARPSCNAMGPGTHPRSLAQIGLHLAEWNHCLCGISDGLLLVAEEVYTNVCRIQLVHSDLMLPFENLPI